MKRGISTTGNSLQQVYDSENLAALAARLVRQKESLAVAESVTSGLLQASLAAATDASDYFQGGVTAYNLLQKSRVLQVDKIHAIECNCVSPQVAEEMARGACRFFHSQWGIGITGYAAPMPERGLEDLYAHFAVVYKDELLLCETIQSPTMDLLDVQLYYVEQVIAACLQLLEKMEVEKVG